MREKQEGASLSVNKVIEMKRTKGHYGGALCIHTRLLILPSTVVDFLKKEHRINCRFCFIMILLI